MHILDHIRCRLIPPIELFARDLSRTVLVAGSGRSGTTWLAQIINWNQDFRLMFEPFHSQKTRCIRNWKSRQYIRPGDTRLMFREPAVRILGGKVQSCWVNQINHVFFARQRLIKDIRANLFLKWIRSEFPEIKIVVLLRHPCAVAASRAHLKWTVSWDDFLVQDELMSDYLEPFRPELKQERDLFEDSILLWCIENSIPLRQFKANEVHLVFYEHLCSNPAATIQSLFNYLEQPFSNHALDVACKPSNMSQPLSAVLSGINPIEAWREYVSVSQLESAARLLSRFGMDKIYTPASYMPLCDPGAWPISPTPPMTPLDKP